MKTDVAIVGGGPGGTACSLFLEKAGIRSIIIEKAEFPRYHIGESMTGECGNSVRALGLGDAMSRSAHAVKWGVSVYGRGGSNRFYVPVKGRDSQGALFSASTWQVLRSDFDSMMLDAARARGVEFIQGKAIDPIVDGDAVRGVRVRADSGLVEPVECSVLIDASGLSTFLSQMGLTGPKERGGYDNQVAIFSQVSDAVRDEGKASGDPIIFYQKKNHWAWFLPLNDEVVSVGVVVPTSYFAAQKETTRDFLIRELHELNPELKRRLPEINLIEEVRAISNYSYRVRRFTGKGFIAIGDAHRFIDPVFSFGMFFSIKEAQLAAQTVAEFLGGAARNGANPFAEHESRCDAAMDVIEELINAFWNQPLAFAVMVHSRHPEDCIDMFAGRVYMDEPSPGLLAFRRLNAMTAGKSRPQ